MLTLLRNMKVVAVRPPYANATGVQIDVEHTSGAQVHCVYRDFPLHPDQLLSAAPLVTERTRLYSLRVPDWWIWCYQRVDAINFENPAKALDAALLVAQDYVRMQGGVPQPFELDKPLTLETAQAVMEVYTFSHAAGR